ncbi:DHA2 family efflux MFS transporter permease subunit [Bosea sp. (in: a-proteobacteria)]|uniref:DHA2 family efflux MFS transporter permease subunit n=1 Tax=Bosea sp. (in: a-proteobacteria) TaxID=1871050 RepID=UPI00086C3357|nr:DHA2 family efflux MFS transporter permease subunit [Bosea sp. (in: a-proteobacteria)]MBN9437963.1 DHA2 family efflux MFS transporter permease subunit [Bosea sp. (in: a-proteobacteria)]MBN9448915.1 DHA2 family efflux MFS transporter permease subunit [Bosea sp. (in: a-proteobacteria)]ODT52804.1 MAG: MFS transporter [Methylobacterium sp. SCN 67-24]
MATATLASPAGTPPASDAIPARRIFAFLAMVFGMFMAILDIQIVSASLAEIQAGLSASADEIAWVQTAYLIAEVIMIPLSGYLSRALSTRVFFTIAAAGFTVASVLCAMSTSINEMILWRAVQGFIGGGMIPGVFAAAFTIFPASKRPIVSPLIGLIATLAPTIGPTIGGYLSHAFSWHWLFLINVVPGIGVSIAAWTLIDFDKPDHSLLKRFDWLGLASMAAFLGSLEYVLEEGTRLDWFQSHEIVFFTGLMLVGCVLFFWRALTRDDPLVDLYAFQNRNFAFGSLFSFTMGIGLYGLTYLYPVYLGRIRGYDALMIGETMFVTGLAMFLTAPIAGRLSAKLDPRIMMMIGFGGFALGTWLASFVTADWDFNELLVPQILRGCSLMLCMVPINNLALGTLPPQQLKNASGLYNLTRNLGGAVGLALINTFLNSRTDLHIARLHEAVAAGRQVAEENLAMLTQRFADYGDAAESMALALMNQRAHKQALVMAFGDIFLALTFVFATLVVLALFMRKPGQAAPGGAGH